MSTQASTKAEKHRDDPLQLVSRIAHVQSSQWQQLGWFKRWLVMVRAPVLVMTISAAITAVLLALSDGYFHADRMVTLIIGLTLAHATNNLINDWVDHRQGVDEDNYFRRRYGTHVLEDRLVSERVFAIVTLITAATALLCGGYLVMTTGTLTLALMLVGAFFVVFYTWPLKHWALGELSVLMVWGPMMIAGGYFVLTGGLDRDVLLLSVIAGIPPTLVILTKHTDKLEQDAAKSIHTLPVVIGMARSRQLCRLLLTLQWLLIAVLLEPWLLVCLVSAPAFWQLFERLGSSPPAEKPDSYPDSIWPLWYTAAAFAYARNFGLTLVAGLLLAYLMR